MNPVEKKISEWFDREKIARFFIPDAHLIIVRDILYNGTCPETDQSRGLFSFCKGLHLSSKKDFKSAIQCYEKAVEEGCVEALWYLAMQSTTEKRDSLLQQGAEKDLPDCTLQLGIIALERNQYSEAEKLLNKALVCMERSFMGGLGQLEKEKLAFRTLGDLYKNIGRYGKMKKAYKSAADKGCTESMYRIAKYYREIKNYDMMKEYHFKAVSKGKVESTMDLADFYRNKGSKKQESYYINAYNYGEKKAAAKLALYYQEIGDLEKLSIWLKRAIESQDSYSKITAGKIFWVLGDREKADALFKSVPSEDNILLIKEAKLWESDFPALTEAIYSLLVQRNHEPAFLAFGHYYWSKNKRAMAIKYYSLGAETDPECMSSLGAAYYRIGECVMALKYSERALRHNEYKAAITMGLATNDKHYDTPRYYKIAADNGLPEGMYMLAENYRELDEIDNALKYYHMAADLGHQQSIDRLTEYDESN